MNHGVEFADRPRDRWRLLPESPRQEARQDQRQGLVIYSYRQCGATYNIGRRSPMFRSTVQMRQVQADPDSPLYSPPHTWL
jgi:hypothetical protein